MDRDSADDARHDRPDDANRLRIVPDSAGTLIDDDFVEFCDGAGTGEEDLREEEPSE